MLNLEKKKIERFEIEATELNMEFVQFTIDSPLTCGICVNGRCCIGWRCTCIFQFELWTEKERERKNFSIKILSRNRNKYIFLFRHLVIHTGMRDKLVRIQKHE